MYRIVNEIATMIKRFLQVLVFFFMSTIVSAAEISIHKNETTGLLTWTVEDDGFTLELIQLLPDFIRAIYAKHNFPADEVERAASYCMFGSILKNTSTKNMSYRVSDWRYVPKDKEGKAVEPLPVKTKTQWLEADSGDFAVGDWQQGFTTIKLPRESEFDLIYKWKLDGVAHTGTLKNLKCAPESLPEM